MIANGFVNIAREAALPTCRAFRLQGTYGAVAVPGPVLVRGPFEDGAGGSQCLAVRADVDILGLIICEVAA
jgi:hypothetical protein